MPCSRLPLHDCRSDPPKRSFREVSAPLATSQILEAELCGPDRSFNSEAAFRVMEALDCEQGPVLDFDFLGASLDTDDIVVGVPAGDRTTVLHLCRNRGACGRPGDQADLVHSNEWKTCAAAQLDRPWRRHLCCHRGPPWSRAR